MAVRFLLLFAALVAVLGVALPASAQEVTSATLLQFTPQAEQKDRYMYRMSLLGSVVRPWSEPDDLRIPEFGVNAVWEDRVTSVTEGMNRHRIIFYKYDVFTMNYSWGINPGEGSGPGGRRPGGGGGGRLSPGGADLGDWASQSGLPSFRNLGDVADEFSMPGSIGFAQAGSPKPSLPTGGGRPYQGDAGEFIGPMQDGGRAGDTMANFSISRILGDYIDYVTLKSGQVIDVRGLELIGDYSDAQVNEEEIVIDARNIFEWTHMLVLPPYPVYVEDFWYAEIPLYVPGLPNQVPVKLYYQVMDFRRVLTRRVAVIDMAGLVDFEQYWEKVDEENNHWEKKYRAFGHMGISARYMFDLDKKEIFAIARPIMIVPRYLFKTNNPFLPGDSRELGGLGAELMATWGMNNPGLSVTTRMRHFTRFEDKRRLRTSAGIEPEYTRKFIDISYFAQMEAE